MQVEDGSLTPGRPRLGLEACCMSPKERMRLVEEAMATGECHQWQGRSLSLTLRHRAIGASGFALTGQELLKRQHSLDPSRRSATFKCSGMQIATLLLQKHRNRLHNSTTTSQLQSVLRHSMTSRLSVLHP